MIQILILSGLGVLAMVSEILNFKKIMPYLIKLGLVATIGSLIMHWGHTQSWFGNMMADDNYGYAFMLVSTVVFLFWMFLFRDTFSQLSSVSELSALVCFAMVGGFMMLSFSNMAMLFMGIEIMSIPVYVLAGSNKKNLKSNESSFKYLLMGAFASGILLFGITFLYGATGSFDTNAIGSYYIEHQQDLPSYFGLGIMLILFGLFFKISAVPFHFWTPDVYEGAPNAVTAFMATSVKGFAVAGTFRLLHHIFGGQFNHYVAGIAGLSALTMLVGNILGAIQDNPKRVLAYSSIGHAGFMLMAILVGGNIGVQSLLYYVAAYSIASLLAFYILHKVLVKDDFYWSIGDFNGLFHRNKLLAISMTIALLSMAGIPPLSGFFAKYFIFNAAFQFGYHWVVLVAIIASLIGVYYYFKFIIAMFMRAVDDDASASIELTMIEQVMIITLCGLIIAMGLFPDSITSLIHI